MPPVPALAAQKAQTATKDPRRAPRPPPGTGALDAKGDPGVLFVDAKGHRSLGGGHDRICEKVAQRLAQRRPVRRDLDGGRRRLKSKFESRAAGGRIEFIEAFLGQGNGIDLFGIGGAVLVGQTRKVPQRPKGSSKGFATPLDFRRHRVDVGGSVPQSPRQVENRPEGRLRLTAQACDEGGRVLSGQDGPQILLDTCGSFGRLTIFGRMLRSHKNKRLE